MHDRRRRQFLQATGGIALTGLAGCSGLLDGDSNGAGSVPSLTRFRGSGPIVEGRPDPGGPSIADLPDLEGTLNLYIGGGEGGIYYRFVELLEEIYPDFEVFPSDGASSSLAQSIVSEVEAGSPQADVFWSIDAASLGFVADADAYDPLPASVTDPVPTAFTGADGSWVGIAGRARSVPYNTNATSAEEIPDVVADFPETDGLAGAMGWAPTYGAFKAFVTAMRLQRGREETLAWLTDMREAGIEQYPNEYVIAQRIADGVLTAGLGNHYYAMRVRNQRPEAPLELAFTSGDAGALVNVAGLLQISGTQNGDLVETFARHLLSAEAQEFFATVSFAYPMRPEVQPVGDLPTVDQLDPPEIDLSELSDLEPTLELMREADVLG